MSTNTKDAVIEELAAGNTEITYKLVAHATGTWNAMVGDTTVGRLRVSGEGKWTVRTMGETADGEFDTRTDAEDVQFETLFELVDC